MNFFNNFKLGLTYDAYYCIFVVDSITLMDSFYIAPTDFSPEINFSPASNSFVIKGNSRPEDVRELFDPALEWLSDFLESLKEDSSHSYTENNPFIFQFDLDYFNSSSAKFFYDFLKMIKRFRSSGIPVSIAWSYEEEDIDMKEAGEDLAFLAEMEFVYIRKHEER